MAAPNENWVYGLRFSPLLWPPPEDGHQRQDQAIAYVECINQLISDSFPEDITQLIQSYYPSKVNRLLDEVLAIFVLHHPEHGHTVIHPILSRVIDGTLVYDKDDPPFSSFISLVGQSDEKEYSEQWALACGEILRVLTHYNRPIFAYDYQVNEVERRSSGSRASTSNSRVATGFSSLQMNQERKPSRPLTPWITDILLAAPLGIRSDYFRWCGGVMGKYAATEELKPPTTASSGQHPQLMPSTPRWAVANGAGVILSVCDEEVTRYETANLTAAAVPALLLPPPTTPFDEHLVVGLPPLEPYARLFHRYYAIATPSATQRLLLGLLEAPPSWAPDALDASVQLVELLRAAEDYVSDMRLPRNWMHLHFLRAIGTAMSMRAGIAADAAAALLFRILSQPTLLFPPSRHEDGVELPQDSLEDCTSTYHKQMEPHDTEATIEATAQGIASMLCAHGPEVEQRICAIWEAAYGLLPLTSSLVDLPAIVVATPLQPPVLSWNLYLPLLKVLEHVPKGSTSESSLMRIFVATVEAILSRTFPPQISLEISKKAKQHSVTLSTSKNLAVAELRTMVHSLFLEPHVSMSLASHLLFVVLTVCVCREVLPNVNKSFGGNVIPSQDYVSEGLLVNGKTNAERARRKQGPVAAFDSFILAAVCALACELQLFPLAIKNGRCFNADDLMLVSANLTEASNGFERGITSAIVHTRRFLGILEALFSLNPSSLSTSWSGSSNEMVAAAMVAAHVSELFGRSKACMSALSALRRCNWDAEICNRATSLYHLIDIHGKAVATILDKAGPLEAHLMHVPFLEDKSRHRAIDKDQMKALKYHDVHKKQTTVVQLSPNGTSTSTETESIWALNSPVCESSRQEILDLPLGASDLANFLTKDNLGRFDYTGHNLLKSIIAKEHETCFSVVSLLWHKLLVTPENIDDGNVSTQHDWMQIVEALCSVVSASPKKASAAIVLQAERDLQPWIARDGAHSQLLWRTNQRILRLISKLMNNPEYRETLIIVASASDLLLRATDGLLVDGEECTLLQLELLQASARAIQIVLDCGELGILLADGLSNLLKCRLPATIRCLSHSSMLVRDLSTSVLQDIMGSVPMKSYNLSHEATKGTSEPLLLHNVSWHANIKQCLKWEAQSRQASGVTTAFLETAARKLGFDCSL